MKSSEQTSFSFQFNSSHETAHTATMDCRSVRNYIDVIVCEGQPEVHLPQDRWGHLTLRLVGDLSSRKCQSQNLTCICQFVFCREYCTFPFRCKTQQHWPSTLFSTNANPICCSILLYICIYMYIYTYSFLGLLLIDTDHCRLGTPHKNSGF